MRLAIAALVGLVTIGLSSALPAGEIDQTTVATCAACHGENGISANPMWPSLAGQGQAYLAKSMKDYRDGARTDALMAPVVEGLSDEDIDALAAYYSGLSGN